MALSLRFSAVSDIGRTRKKNDDSGYAGPQFIMVADGMGGAAAGDLASAVAVQTMLRLDAPPPDDLLEALAGAVHRANDRLAELIEEDASVEGMGTTVTAAIFDGTRIGVAHLGDSRGYIWRDGELLRITHDHTWVQSLIDEGRITEEEAKTHSHRSLLLKVLDGRHDNDPDLTVYDVQAGDRLLICSDGLSGFVDHDRIERALSIGTADEAAHELLQLALDAMSTDNITVVVADVVDDEAPGSADAAGAPVVDVTDTADIIVAPAEPMIVGSAAEQPRGALSRLRHWAHRDELEPREALVDVDVDPEELRYAPREPKRFRWLIRGLGVAVVLAVVAFVGIAAYNWSQTRYYVGAHDGKVVIFKGVEASLPGIRLHHVYETEDLDISQLSSYRRGQVLGGLPAESLDHAHEIVAKLVGYAAVCADQLAVPTGSSDTVENPRATETTQTANNTRAPSSHKPAQPGTAKPRHHPTNRPTNKPTHKPTQQSSSAPTTTTTGSTDDGGGSSEECSGATPIPVSSP